MKANGVDVMRVMSLQSGSDGNCVYLEAGGTKVLIDAGISGLATQRRLAAHGIDVHQVDALLITHEHRDHTNCLGILHRKFRIPVYVTEKTLAKAARATDLGPLSDVRHFSSGDTMRIGALRIETLATPHDAVDGVVFVFEDGHHRVGVMTDLGHVFEGLDAVVRTLDGVFIESNYDSEMLANGPYPEQLKRRIQGPNGHISNDESAELLARAGRRLRWACLAHLSAENNHPDVALRTHHRVLGRRLPLLVAPRHQATDLLHIA